MKNFRNAAQLRLARRRNTKSKIKKMTLMSSPNAVKPATPPKVKPAQQLNALSWKPPKTSDTVKYGQLVSAAAQNRVKKNKGGRKTDVIRNVDTDRGDNAAAGVGTTAPPVKGVKWNTPRKSR